MALKGYKITPAVRARLAKARAAVKPKQRDPNALKPGDPKYKGRIKKFRKTHKVFRNKCRRTNYIKSRPSVRKNRPWLDGDIKFLICPELDEYGFTHTDVDLAFILNRSVQAIQQKRYMLKNKT